MKLSILLISILLSLTSNSQSSYNYVKHYANNPPEAPLSDIRDSYVLADDVLFRNGPGSSYEVVRSLSIGTPIKLISADTTISVINGIQSNWYKAAIDEELIGYVWGGLIAQNQFGSSHPDGVKFLLGLEKFVEEEDTDNTGNKFTNMVFYTQLRAFKNGKEIAKYSHRNSHQEFDISAQDSYGYGTGNLGQAGVKNVHDIIQLHVPCRGGCGCSTGDVYIAWTGSEFKYLTESWGTADAQYSEGNGIIFPNAMNGETGFIIKSINRIIWDSSEDYENRKDRREQFLEYYIWDGENLNKTARKSESVINDIKDY